MAAQRVVLAALAQARRELRALRGADRPMVVAHLLGERAGAPTAHARARDRRPVDAAALDGLVAADLLVARAPEHLAGARHVLDVGEAVVVLVIAFAERGARDAEPGVLREAAQEELEVVRVEGDVGVEVADDVVGQVAQRRVAGVERTHLAGEVALRVLGRAHEADPRMARGVALDDLVRPVGGAVADHDVALRQDGLGDHGLDRLLDQAGLVAGRRDHDVAQRGTALVGHRRVRLAGLVLHDALSLIR